MLRKFRVFKPLHISLHKSLNIRHYYKILGIETSCDDTGVAIVDSNHTIISESLITHEEICKQFGGNFKILIIQ